MTDQTDQTTLPDLRRTVGAGPVAPLAATMLRPLPLAGARIVGGFLGRLQRENEETTVPQGHEHLVREQAFENLERAAAREVGPHHGPVFEDGEVFKWLEAVGWEAEQDPTGELGTWLERYSALAARAQADDGYLSTYNQSAGVRERWEWISYDHEIFNMATMIQAAVAQHRTTGSTVLLQVARRAADHLDDTFGWGKREETCGHPLVEMALVELFRSTGEERYLELARYFVEVRGHRTITDPTWQGWTPVYFSDRVPVREAEHVEGHAVRAVYLAAGATDLAVETGDAELLAVLERQWANMVDAKMYVNGSLGSRWEGEAFGEPYELPSDRGYGETCAAIASIQWSWRLLLATGEARYADLIERQLYNAVLSGRSQDGQKYFYVNTLQVREGAVAHDDRMGAAGRQPWFGCSCCPTNLMRTLATLHHLLATEGGGEDGGTRLQIHQFADAEIHGGGLHLRMRTGYPFQGRIELEVLAAEPGEREMALRIPGWADGARLTAADGGTSAPAAGGYARVRREWAAGDRVVLELPTEVRRVRPHHRNDSARGSVALERGPLVLALEHVDQDPAVRVDDLALTGAAITDRLAEVAGLGEIPVAEMEVVVRPENARRRALAIPYFLWANREIGPMRVWIPEGDRTVSPDEA